MQNYILPLLIALFLFLPPGAQGQLLEVKQTVFGMDCAPCAYALENRINSMDGVNSATVSLNNGRLTATMSKGNTLTLYQIQKAVKESGFSPKKAKIKVTGVLKKANGRYFIITPSDEKYDLYFDEVNTEEHLGNTGLGQNITLSGEVSPEAKETDYWSLVVDNISS